MLILDNLSGPLIYQLTLRFKLFGFPIFSLLRLKRYKVYRNNHNKDSTYHKTEKCWGNNKEKTLSFKMNRRIKPNKLSNKRDRKKRRN